MPPSRRYPPRPPGLIRAVQALTLVIGLLMATLVVTPASTALAGSARGPAQADAADPVVVAAGDISPDSFGAQVDTADLVQSLNPTRVLVPGDAQYPRGTLSTFNKYYDATWGQFKSITRPVPGNHEYKTTGAAGFFSYFGALAGSGTKGYYGFDLGGWRIIGLNSNIARGSSSAQLSWLRAELDATSKPCVLAFWHHPRFSSGSHHASNSSVAPFWTELYAGRADIVLNGHEHHYERFGPQTPAAVASAAGIREFVVGTGGAETGYGFGTPRPNSQVRIDDVFGVLELTLKPSSYTWRFLDTDSVVRDQGGPVACH